MTAFRPRTIVWVPFRYSDRDTRQHRPALVVASHLGPERGQLWVLMITSAENRRWPGDVWLEQDYADAGLPVPSLIRTEKIATIDARLAEERGEIGGVLLAEVGKRMTSHLGGNP